MKKGKKLVKSELIVALKGELYFVKFIINPEEDDFEPEVVLGRSFMRLDKGVVDFDTAGSKGKKVTNALSFYKIETYEITERYIAPCFVNGLEAYDGEINLAFDENMISNEFAIKLCWDYEMKK
nr:hypothetical protein [Tanacetum cinerariifolium]